MEKDNNRYFMDLTEVCYGRWKMPVVMYDKQSHKAKHVAYNMVYGCISIDNLPRTGYSYSNYETEDYGKKFVFLTCEVYPFCEVLFLDAMEEYPVLDLETGEIKKATIELVLSGIGTCFCLTYGSEKIYRTREDYEVKFVVLKETSDCK